jgi:hypothetical protein
MGTGLLFWMEMMTMNHNLQTETIQFGPRKIYKCDKDNRSMERQDTWKDHTGTRRCTACGEPVRDVTHTETGQDFIQVLGL